MSDFLPELPKLKKKREQDLTPMVLQWFRDNYKGSCAIEIKVCTGNVCNIARVEKHQIAALLQSASPRGLVYKIPDSGYAKKPYDAFMLQSSPQAPCGAYVVVVFTKKRQCLVIDASEWRGARVDSLCAYRFGY